MWPLVPSPWRIIEMHEPHEQNASGARLQSLGPGGKFMGLTPCSWHGQRLRQGSPGNLLFELIP